MSHQNMKKKSGGFQSMGLSFSVFKGVMKKGYRVPTPIQRKTIPVILDGKDMVAMARTGSGKTAAFLLPMFERLKVHSTKIGVRALILSPTRELATQTMKFIKDLGKFTDLRAAVVLGGDKMDDQFTALHENPDIVVATPGRFLHLVVEMELKLLSIEYVVFDEADRLFEMGFSEQLREILRRLPEMRQTLLFSATLPKLLVDFAKAGLKDPVLIRLDVDNKLSEQLQTSYFYCRHDDKPAVLLHFLHNIIDSNQQTVVFVATKHDVEYLRHLLLTEGVDTSFVYSSLDQTARKICIGKFLHKKTNVMIVTDVAARGIDIPLLDNVINYNFPSKPKLFVHRVGRVARAGRSGSAYSLVSPDEVPYLLDVHLFLGRSLTTTGKEGVLGSIPQSIIDGQADSLRHAHSANSDLVSLQQVAANGMKQYIKSRNQPSPESVKRSKQLLHPLPTHPLFSDQLSSSEIVRNQLLDSLKTYKSSRTIFDINSTATNSQAKRVMNSKRAAHLKIVSANREKRTSEMFEHKVGVAVGVVKLASEEDLKGFNAFKVDKKTKSSQPYISYTPSDHHTEKGLSIENGTVSFDQQASSAVLDLIGDEKEQMKRSNNTTKWDRKRKRFVKENSNGKEGAKRVKVKTESGSWISASYKSGRYKRWKQGTRHEGIYGGEEQQTKGRGHSKRGGVSKHGGPSTSGGKRKKGGNDGPGRLMAVKDIMKKREKMAFMRKKKQIREKKRKK